MHLEAALACAMGFLSQDEVDTIRRLLEAYGLPSRVPGGIAAERLVSLMALDKKAAGGELTFVLPREIGKVVIQRGADIDLLTGVLTA
jgi:3-dehydroquinate synthase